MREDDRSLVIIGSRGLPARYGGFETLAEVLSMTLTSSGYSVHVAASRRISKLKYLGTFVGAIVASRPYTSLKNVRFLVVNPINCLVAYALISLGHFVVVHMDGRDDLRAKWCSPLRRIARFAQGLCLGLQVPIIFDSESVAEELAMSSRRDVHIITYGGCRSCGNDKKFWNGKAVNDEFVNLGRAVPENQTDVIMHSVLGTSRDWRLLVVSTALHRDRFWGKLNQIVSRSSNLRLIDGIWNVAELCDLYRSSAGVIHGHSVGGTNPSLVLALSHGTPVFAHDNPYNREVAGSLARYWKDEQELTKLLDEFDPSTWPYDQAAVDDFNRRYNWDDVVEKYKRVLGLD